MLQLWMPGYGPVHVLGEFEEHCHLLLSTVEWLKQQFTKYLQCLRLSAKYLFVFLILTVSQWGKAIITLILEIRKQNTNEAKDKQPVSEQGFKLRFVWLFCRGRLPGESGFIFSLNEDLWIT